jgi:hypothetical protein
MRISVVAIICGALVTSSAALAKDPWSFGFISANVTCKPEYGAPTRLLITSQVFGFCASEISADAILGQESFKIDQAAKVTCGLGTYEVTYKYIDVSTSRETAQQKLERAKQSNNFHRFEAIYASESRSSSKCGP